jgi:hypothetical protein
MAESVRTAGCPAAAEIPIWSDESGAVVSLICFDIDTAAQLGTNVDHDTGIGFRWMTTRYFIDSDESAE